MGYLDEYNARRGNCEYCTHSGPNRRTCVDCKYHFEDDLDFYTFVRAKVTKEATEEFKKTDVGAKLYEIMETCRLTYVDSRDTYDKALRSYVDNALSKLDNSLNSI